MSRSRFVVLIVAAAAGVGVIGWSVLRTTPLEAVVEELERSDYFFEADPVADPGLSPSDAAAAVVSGEEPLLGPVAGYITHDSAPTRHRDYDDEPVYLFLVDDLHDPGAQRLDGPPPPERHAVLVYERSGAVSVTAIPYDD